MKHNSPRPWVGALLLILVASAALAADEVSLTGVLLQDSEGAFVLQTGDKIYLVEGRLPDSLAGRRVVLTGRVEQGDEDTLWLIVTGFAKADKAAGGRPR
ncbi:MAG: hypothetical protein KKB20_26605 [Proteobacteria bacterium]|nr:hypothetical protein [Pseudomonadota bacterium]